MATLIDDIKYTFRQLLKNPGFSTIAVLTLALGIGANTALFSQINASAWRPTLARRPKELVIVYGVNAYPTYLDVRKMTDTFASLAALSFQTLGVSTDETVQSGWVGLVSADFISTFGVPMEQGRAFLPEEEKPGSNIPVVIVSYQFWKRAGADPNYVGMTLRIKGRPCTVVGVAPKDFTGSVATIGPMAWLPLGMYNIVGSLLTPQGGDLNDRNHAALLHLVGRLKPGVSKIQAQARLNVLAKRLSAEYPPDEEEELKFTLAPIARANLSNEPPGPSPSWVIRIAPLVVTGFVLLLASINVANMLLVRGMARQKEIAVRSALGASQTRVLRQLLTEATILSVLGGTAGVLAAHWVLDLFAAFKLSFLSGGFVSVTHAEGDPRVLVASVGFCIGSVLLFGLVPAMRLIQCDVVTQLKDQAQIGRLAGRRLFGLDTLAVASQIAISFALLVIAGLFIRSVSQAAKADLGFMVDNSMVVEVDVGVAGYDEARGRAAFGAILERLRSLPNVKSVSFGSIVPFTGASYSTTVGKTDPPEDPTSDFPLPPPLETVGAHINVVGPDYFKTLGIPLLHGREFNVNEVAKDIKKCHRVVIIDQPLAEKLWPEQEALGQWLYYDGHPQQVIGIVASVNCALMETSPKSHVYLPFCCKYSSAMNIHVRTSADTPSDTMANLLRQTIRAVDDQLPVARINPLGQLIKRHSDMYSLRSRAQLLTISAVIGLVLVAVGIYGVRAQAVARRTREMGLRMALGATKVNVLGLVLREGMKLVIVGLSMGLLLAIVAGRLVKNMLFGVGPLDLLTILVAVICLGGAMLLASYIPAWRAAKIDPMEALRYE